MVSLYLFSCTYAPFQVDSWWVVYAYSYLRVAPFWFLCLCSWIYSMSCSNGYWLLLLRRGKTSVSSNHSIVSRLIYPKLEIMTESETSVPHVGLFNTEWTMSNSSICVTVTVCHMYKDSFREICEHILNSLSPFYSKFYLIFFVWKFIRSWLIENLPLPPPLLKRQKKIKLLWNCFQFQIDVCSRAAHFFFFFPHSNRLQLLLGGSPGVPLHGIEGN